jgi:hypothetical protein
VLKIKQKDGTSLVKLVLSRRKSGFRTERLSVPVILGEYTAKVYGFVYKKVHPRLIPMPLKEGIHNLTHSLLQRGDPL